MWEQAQRRLAMTTALKTAVKEQGFTNYYQAVHDSRSGQIVGVEALVRWDDDEFGRVSPGEFIPLAEANGSIVSIGAQVLEMALADVARWRRDGLWNDELFLSVNLSPLQLVDIGFTDMLEASLERWQVAARCPGTGNYRNRVHAVRSSRHRHARPAARTGRAPGDRRFRQRLFLADPAASIACRLSRTGPELILQIDQESTDLVSPVAEIAAMLDLQVIAEGIETQAQLERLAGMGVPMIQGFPLLLQPRPRLDARPGLRASLLDCRISAERP
ncbi:MAG: EAL domain-containing protein [Arhodomonas sp.]|nr:EAL domain-containing protein [Arhodomonas sp.]